MPTKCRKSNNCCNSCDNDFSYQVYCQPNWQFCQPACQPVCQPVCPCPCPPPPPVLLTNIAVTGTGPFGLTAQIGFTVTNTTLVPAQNVNVVINAPVAQGAIQTGVAVSAGFVTPNPLPNNAPNFIWTIGTLLGGQSANIVINQVNGPVATTWTAVGSTSTPEITLVDNTAFVIVPIPQ